jgi:hypothetical protein
MSFVSQAWRAVRLGGAAFAAQYVAAGVTHPKQGYVAGAIAAVEVIYRTLVPVAEQGKLLAYWKAIQASVASSAAVAPKV